MEEVIQSRQGRKQLKEEPPDSQGNESIQAIASGDRPVEEVIQSKQGWKQLKEEPPEIKECGALHEHTLTGGGAEEEL